MEEYYQKVIHLQDKLRKSEEDRLNLEIKFNETLQSIKEEEEAYFKRLRSKYKNFLEEDRQRQQRNDKILESLERIESRTAIWQEKTEKFKERRKMYQKYLKQQKRAPDDLEVPFMEENTFAKSEIVEKYMSSLSSQNTAIKSQEDKYPKLGNISSLYHKPPKTYEIDELTKLKTSKDKENVIKQNSDIPHWTTRHTEDYDTETKESPQQIHNNLERLLSETYIPRTFGKTAPLESLAPSQNHPPFAETKPSFGKPVLPITKPMQEVERIVKSHDLDAIEISPDEAVPFLQKFYQKNLQEPQETRLPQSNNEHRPTLTYAGPDLQQINSESLRRDSNVTVQKEPEALERRISLTQSKLVSPDQQEMDNDYACEKGLRYEKADEQAVELHDTLDVEEKHPELLYDQQYDEKKQEVGDVSQTEPEQNYDKQLSQMDQVQRSEEYNDSTQRQYDQNGQHHGGDQHQTIPEVRQNGQMQYDTTAESFDQLYQQYNQYDENGQLLQQYDENNQHLQLYDHNGQLPQQYEQTGLQYDENGQPVYDTQQLQYDENGQLLHQYDQNGQISQQYEQSGDLQYDENGQPVVQDFQQYDENGQAIYQYDENGQPLQLYDQSGQLQYDENGQPIYQYDENGQVLQQYYDEGEQPVEYYDEQQYFEGQTQEGQYSQEHFEAQPLDVVKKEVSEETPKLDEITEKPESEPVANPNTKNVLDILETDSESVKQDTKISNDSDFDFSNG